MNMVLIEMVSENQIFQILSKIKSKHIVPLSSSDLDFIIDHYREQIQIKSTQLINNINLLNAKVKKNPILLLDDVHGVKKFGNVKKHIRTKYDTLYQYVPDIGDRIQFLIEDRKLFFSPPSYFKDKKDTDFSWARDMFNITIGDPEFEDSFRQIYDLIGVDENQIDSTIESLGKGNYLIDGARNICRVRCLCKTHADPRMWKEYALDNGICVQFSKRISHMAYQVMYNYVPESTIDVRNCFLNSFEKIAYDDQAVEEIGRLFSIIYGEHFVSPLFKGSEYSWENECRIIKSAIELEDDGGKSYMNLLPADIKHVYISSKMSLARKNEIIDVCKNNKFKFSIYEY